MKNNTDDNIWLISLFHSDDARYILLGTAEGEVHVFGTKYLNRLNKSKAHEW